MRAEVQNTWIAWEIRCSNSNMLQIALKIACLLPNCCKYQGKHARKEIHKDKFQNVETTQSQIQLNPKFIPMPFKMELGCEVSSKNGLWRASEWSSRARDPPETRWICFLMPIFFSDPSNIYFCDVHDIFDIFTTLFMLFHIWSNHPISLFNIVWAGSDHRPVYDDTWSYALIYGKTW